MKIAFVGMSHLGIVSSAAAAAHGFDTLGFDGRADLIKDLQAGRLPVHEPGLPELIKENSARMRYSSDPADLAQCDLVYFSLDVPTNSANQSDVAPIAKLVLESNLKRGAVAVVLSQVPPGFTRSLRPALEAKGVDLCYQVETLVFGIAVERAMKPERYMVGCADPANVPAPLKKHLEAYKCPILPMRFESAELAKISINFYLTSTVTVTNTLAEVCEKIGADWAEIAPAMRLDRRIGPYAYLTPGLGLAGGNLERDLVTIQGLSREHGTHSTVVDAWVGNSVYRRDWTYRTLVENLVRANPNPRVGFVGLAYKPGTHSLKNAPSLLLLERLLGFEVNAFDPVAKIPATHFGAPSKAKQAASIDEALKGADAAVVFTDYPEFRALAPEKMASLMKGRLIVDPFAVLNRAAFEKAGFRYYTLGVSN